jgi:hypothetical protein
VRRRVREYAWLAMEEGVSWRKGSVGLGPVGQVRSGRGGAYECSVSLYGNFAGWNVAALSVDTCSVTSSSCK